MVTMAKRPGRTAHIFRSAGRWSGYCIGLTALAFLPGLAKGQGKARPPRDNGELPPPKVVPGQKLTEAYLDLGRKKMEQNDLPGALTAFTKAHEVAPKDPRPLYFRGEIYQQQKNVQKAEADFRAALQLDPRLYDVRAELGAILTDAGRSTEAVEQLEQAVKGKPDSFEAQYNLAVANEALSRWSQAAEA